MKAFAPARAEDKKAAKGFSNSRVSERTLPGNHLSGYSAAPIFRKASCSCGGGCPNCQNKPAIQTKLSVSEPGDIYEQEADHVADLVMRMPEQSAQHHSSPSHNAGEGQMVQRKPLASTITPLIQRQSLEQVEDEEATEDKFHIQRFAEGDRDGGDVLDNFLSSIGPGSPLDPQTRSFFEPRFGHDFSEVRVHTDARASASARSLQALAHTHGPHIAFRDGAFSPSTVSGQKLLAHELTHVVQQRPLIQRQADPAAPQSTVPGAGEGLNVMFVVPHQRFTPDIQHYMQTVLDVGPGVEITSLDQMFEYLKAIADAGQKVRRIRLVSHGLVSGEVSIYRTAGDRVQWATPKAVAKYARRDDRARAIIQRVMAPGAIVEFWGCSIGRSSQALEAWSNLFQSPFRATTETFKTGFFKKFPRPAAKGERGVAIPGRPGKWVATRRASEIDPTGPQAAEFNAWLLWIYDDLVRHGDIAPLDDIEREEDSRARQLAYMRDLFDRSDGDIRYIEITRKSDPQSLHPIRPGDKEWAHLWAMFKPEAAEALANENAPAPAQDQPAPPPVSPQPPIGLEAAIPGGTPPSEIREQAPVAEPPVAESPIAEPPVPRSAQAPPQPAPPEPAAPETKTAPVETVPERAEETPAEPPPIPTEIPVREPTKAPPIPTDIPVREPTGEWATGGQSATPMSPPMAEQPPRKTTPEPTRPVPYSSDCLAADSSPSGVVFGRIPFASDHADVAHPADLERFVGLLGANRASWPIRVDGYASTDGPEDYNFRLSCRRAQTVRDQLMRLGVPASHVTTYAHGETSEFSATNRAENRVAIVSASPGSGLETVRTPSQRLPGEGTVSRHDRRDEPHLVSTGVQAAAEVARMLPTARPVTVSQMGWVTLTPGMVFDDETMLIAADGSVVYYAQGHSLYRMSTSTFLRSSLWFGSLTKAAKSASVWSKVAEIEAALLEAIFVPWYILAAVNLAGAVLTYVARKDQVDKVVGNALRAARRTLHLVQEFYQLYPNLSKRLMWRLGNEMIRNLPVLFLTLAREIELDDIAFFVGRLIHHDWIKAGAQVAWVPAIATGPAHKVIAKTALQVFALHSPKLAERAVERYVEESVSAFRANMHDEGVEMSDEEARVLLREMALHPDVSQRMKVIEAALQDLGPALEALSKTLTPKGAD